ncbi:MAG: OmpA family protein, partial [Mesorhizobium sp.]
MRSGSLAFVFTVALFSTHAFADPLQKSEDIVKFFDAASELGPPRGICVGTEEECNGKNKAAPAKKTSLDMLINFDLDSAELDATARAELDEFAKALKDS